MCQIPHAWGCRAYLSMWEEEGAFCVECCQVLLVIGAVSLLELAEIAEALGCLRHQTST